MPESGGSKAWFSFGGGGGGGGGGGTSRTSGINIPGITRQEPTFADEMCEACPTLTYQQRVIGFVVCVGVGYVFSFLGSMMLIGGGIREFAALYVLGSLIALSATGFLIGPKSQCKKMFKPTRRIACIVYLTLLVVVFAVAIAGLPVGLVLILLIIQCIAAVWYMASYIPYGRKMIKSVCCPCLKDLEEEGGSG